jgi:glycosidase
MSEKGATIAGLKLANVFVLTTRGVPQLYYGDEIAMTGPDEPTTRGDFPGGPRTKEERELFEYVRGLIRLRQELEPLKTGKLRNLYVSEQQYAYARGSVVVVINNENDQAEVQWDTDLADGIVMHDRLGVSREIEAKGGRLKASLPKRSAAIFVRKDQ